MVFRRYPQLIRYFFNSKRFGPPRRFNCASPWPWVDRLVSGLWHTTGAPYSDSLSLRLRRSRLNLAAHHNSPVHYPRSTPSPGSCDHWAPTGCRHTVSGTISLPFRGAFHLSLTVLVRYRSLRVFSLRGWSPWIHARYHVPGATWVMLERSLPFAYGAITLCGSTFTDIFGWIAIF